MARTTPFTRNTYTFTVPHSSVDCAGSVIPYLESQNKTPCDSRAEDFAYLEEAASERFNAATYIFDRTYSPAPGQSQAWTDHLRYYLRALRDRMNQNIYRSFLYGMPSGVGFTVNEDEDEETKFRAFFPFSWQSPGWDVFPQGFPSVDLEVADVSAFYSRLGVLRHMMLLAPDDSAWHPSYFTFYDTVEPVHDFSVDVSVPVNPFFLQHAAAASGGGLSALFVGRFAIYGNDFSDGGIPEKVYYFFETPALTGGAFTLSIPSAANFVKRACARFGETFVGYKSATLRYGTFPDYVIFSDFFHTGL